MVIYLDSGDLEQMLKYQFSVAGFTTNPSLLRASGVSHYAAFAIKAIEIAVGKPLSLEVFSDDMDEMLLQARVIGSWAPNVYVKVPITNTRGFPTGHVISKLSREGVRVNVTCLMTLDQVRYAARHLYAETPAILSIFAGRIADTGVNPETLITEALRIKHDKTKVLWASTRELWNIKQAEKISCDIITVSPQILAKTNLFGKNLTEYSLETVKQFHSDGQGMSL